MLAASPVLRTPRPSASNESTLHTSVRYGERQATADSKNHQDRLGLPSANGVKMRQPSGMAAMSSPPSGPAANHSRRLSNDGSTSARNGPASPSPPANRCCAAEGSSAKGPQVANNSKEGAATRRPTSSLTQADSPSIKRRQAELGTLPTASHRNPHSELSPLPLKRPKTEKKESKILPAQYELCDVEDIVILIADMIAELIQTNDNLPLQDGVLTRFHSRTPPGISVIDYLQRLAKYAILSAPLLLSMVYYIDLLCAKYASFTITSLTVHRFLITAATVAAKGLSDSFWNNTTYARVGGIKLAELGLLELDFLHRVDWRIVPSPEVLVDYYIGLVSRSNKYELDGDHRPAQSTATAKREDAEDTHGPESAPIPADGELENGKTDKKWEKWMKDVADEARK